MSGTERSRSYTWRGLAGSLPPLAEVDGMTYLRRQVEDPAGAGPIVHTLGWRMVEVDEGRVVLSLPVREYLLHGGGIVHGGVLTTLADSAMSNAVMSRLDRGQGCVTTQLNANFLQAVREGDSMLCEGRVVRSGRRVAFAEATLRDSAGKVCLLATSTFAIFDLR